MKKLVVAWIDHATELGGAELAMIETMRNLRRYEAHAILTADGDFASRLRAVGVSVHVVPLSNAIQNADRSVNNLAAVRSAFASALYSMRIGRLCRKIRADIIHCNTLRSGFYGIPAGRMFRIPVVWHVRDQWKTPYLSEMMSRACRFIAQGASALVYNSASTRRAARVSSSAIQATVYSPVSRNSASVSRPPDRRKGLIRIVMVGRLAEWKGQHLLLEALPLIQFSGNLEATFVGGPLFGESAYEERLHQLAALLDDDISVSFVGQQDDIHPFISSADIAVSASITPEPFGQVVVQTMLAGIPTVAPQAGGPVEIITHGVDGLLFTPGDPASLASAISNVIGNVELASSISAAGTETARRFLPEEIVPRIESIYDLLVSS